jgi:hypothetical protein
MTEEQLDEAVLNGINSLTGLMGAITDWFRVQTEAKKREMMMPPGK